MIDSDRVRCRTMDDVEDEESADRESGRVAALLAALLAIAAGAIWAAVLLL